MIPRRVQHSCPLTGDIVRHVENLTKLEYSLLQAEAGLTGLLAAVICIKNNVTSSAYLMILVHLSGIWLVCYVPVDKFIYLGGGQFLVGLGRQLNTLSE